MCACGGCSNCLREQHVNKKVIEEVEAIEKIQETEDEHYNRLAEQDFVERMYEQDTMDKDKKTLDFALAHSLELCLSCKFRHARSGLCKKGHENSYPHRVKECIDYKEPSKIEADRIKGKNW
jgi:hypothetical protein